MSDAPQIESGIPLPPYNTKRERKSKYPFARMNVGDSFFVPTTNETFDNIRHAVYAAACHYAKRNGGGRYKTRAVPGGLRIWRVASTPQGHQPFLIGRVSLTFTVHLLQPGHGIGPYGLRPRANTVFPSKLPMIGMGRGIRRRSTWGSSALRTRRTEPGATGRTASPIWSGTRLSSTLPANC